MFGDLQQVETRRPPSGGRPAGAGAFARVADEAGLLSEARSIVRMFRIFANIERTMILFMIAERSGTTVNDIMDVVKLSRPYVYQHVNRLLADGWIKSIRRGQAKSYVCSSLDVHLLLRSLRAEIGRGCGD